MRLSDGGQEEHGLGGRRLQVVLHQGEEHSGAPVWQDREQSTLTQHWATHNATQPKAANTRRREASLVFEVYLGGGSLRRKHVTTMSLVNPSDLRVHFMSYCVTYFDERGGELLAEFIYAVPWKEGGVCGMSDYTYETTL